MRNPMGLDVASSAIAGNYISGNSLQIFGNENVLFPMGTNEQLYYTWEYFYSNVQEEGVIGSSKCLELDEPPR